MTSEYAKNSTRPVRIAAVSFINTVPLIDGLEDDPSINLTKSVPSALLSRLEQQKVDVALIPSIDYQTARTDLRIIRAGAIGSLTQSLTVRIFSRKPISELKTLACDTDSHTSVFLARILLKEIYNIDPDVTRITCVGNTVSTDTDAVLLIGDKVITAKIEAPLKKFQLDLAESWRKFTGMGFVFAVWACLPQFQAEIVALTLKRTLKNNLRDIDGLVEKYALQHNWPKPAARKYLTENMYYLLDHKQLTGLRLFYSLAYKHGLIRRQRTIRFAEIHSW